MQIMNKMVNGQLEMLQRWIAILCQVDRTGWYRPDSSTNNQNRNRFHLEKLWHWKWETFLPALRHSGGSQVYNDDRLYDAFDYNRRPSSEQAVDNFEGDEEDEEDVDGERRPQNGDRRNWDKYSGGGYNVNRYSHDGPRDKDRYEKETYNKRYPTDRYTSDRHTFNIYDADRTSNRFLSDDERGSWGNRPIPMRYPSR